MPVENHSENQSQSAVLDWDSYDLNQFLQDPSESGVSISSFLTKFGTCFSNRDSQHYVLKTHNNAEDLYSPVLHFQKYPVNTAAPVAENDIVFKQPKSKAKNESTCGPEHSTKCGIWDVLCCCCLTINDHGYAKGFDLHESSVKQQAFQSKELNNSGRIMRTIRCDSDALSGQPTKPVWMSCDLEESTENYTGALVKFNEASDIAQPLHGTSTHSLPDVHDRNPCNFECNESCCSFQHWKEKNFHSLPKRKSRRIATVGPSAQNEDYIDNTVDSPIFSKEKLELTTGNEMYTLAFDCLNSHSTILMPSRRAMICNEQNGCSSSNCSFVRISPQCRDKQSNNVGSASNFAAGNSPVEQKCDMNEPCPKKPLSSSKPTTLKNRNKGDTSLHRACIAGHDLIVKRLLEEGCSVDRQNQLGDSALHEASSRGYSRCVKALIEGRANIGLRNKNGDTAIHLACANSHAESLRQLLSSYPHSSPKNEQGDSPLHVAVRFGHVTCARVLISARCTVDLQNKRGATALHIATVARHRKLVRVLLDAGAQAKTILNSDGKSALDLAKDNDDGETAIMLISGPRQPGAKQGARGRSGEKKAARQRSLSEPRRHGSRRRKNPEKNGGSSSPLAPRKDFNQRPKSATLPRKSYVQARAKWRRHLRQKLDDCGKGTDLLEKHQRHVAVNPFVVPQLYSLYRDDSGKICQKPVLDHLPNPTPEIVNSITVAVENTKGELLHEIQKTNHLLEKRLDQLENDTEYRVAKLDQITKERINAERLQCLHRIDRRATLERVVHASRRKEYGTCSGSDTVQNDHSRQKMDCGTIKMNSRLPQTKRPVNSHSGGEMEISGTFVECRGDQLEPYRTVTIDRGCYGRTNTVKQKPEICQRAFPSNLDRSDSAYGSLSPRPMADVLQAEAEIPYHEINSKQHHAIRNGRKKDVRQAKVPGFRPYLNSQTYLGHSTPLLPQKKDKASYASYSEEDAGVAQKVTQQFFENVTYAMEDWYERRLHEATDRQQKELNKRVTELENRVKFLQVPSNTDSPLNLGEMHIEMNKRKSHGLNL